MFSKSDNCCICEYEFENEHLRPVIANSFKVCYLCASIDDTANDYNEVSEVIGSYVKFAQQTDPELASPEIKVEPADTLIQEAVNMLKKINPTYFVGVRKIVLDGGNAFGHVSSGGNNDPAVIHINLAKIKSELDAKLTNASPEQKQKELVRQIALTISHERGHVASFKPDAGFVGGEQPGLAEEQSMAGKLASYYDATKKLR